MSGEGEALLELGACPFHEDVGDGSMCLCGLPALDHDALARRVFLQDHPQFAGFIAELEAQIHDLLEEREELLTEIRRLRMGNHPAGRALDRHLQQVAEINAAVERDNVVALRRALTERDAGHEGGEGA